MAGSIPGDVAVMDNDGYFQIINRKQDTIIFGEYSVYPRDVEEVIYENAKVVEVAVVGVGTADGRAKGQGFCRTPAGQRLDRRRVESPSAAAASMNMPYPGKSNSAMSCRNRLSAKCCGACWWWSGRVGERRVKSGA